MITFLNMLIAIMGDTFARVSEAKEQNALSEKIKILADHVVIVDHSDEIESEFVFALSPESLSPDEQGWEGIVQKVRKLIDLSAESSKKDAQQKFNIMQDRMQNFEV